MKKPFTVITILTLSSFLVACGGGSTSGGVGRSTSGLYRGTISYSGYNTCGANIPGSGKIEIVITSSGKATFNPIGLSWGGGKYGSVNFNSLTDSFTSTTSGYKYRINGRINDNGATISGTGYVEGNYGSCYEKFQGSFAGNRVG
ncbi:MAG TPA: hypothetical protein EYQ14_21350 [Gammaproteobacteria bacterium]|nr:hypothetical protein [Gammaproteobacteria bacterium]